LELLGIPGGWRSMHELSIAESILAAVRKEVASRPGSHPIRVGLRIGQLAAVDVDSLTFCFEAVLKGTDWENLQLDARVCPIRRICRDCGHEFAVVEYDATCPECAGTDTKLSSGDELDFDYLEVETDGALATEVKGVE
jgi:hydrogenase nickel incorporation protein HypA/HybF